MGMRDLRSCVPVSPLHHATTSRAHDICSITSYPPRLAIAFALQPVARPEHRSQRTLSMRCPLEAIGAWRVCLHTGETRTYHPRGKAPTSLAAFSSQLASCCNPAAVSSRSFVKSSLSSVSDAAVREAACPTRRKGRS